MHQISIDLQNVPERFLKSAKFWNQFQRRGPLPTSCLFKVLSSSLPGVQRHSFRNALEIFSNFVFLSMFKSDQFLLGCFFGVQFKILSCSGSGRAELWSHSAQLRFSWALCRWCTLNILGCRCSAASSTWLITSRWDLKELALPHYIPLWLWSWQLPQLPFSLCDVNTVVLSGPNYARTPLIIRGKLSRSALRRVHGSAAVSAPSASAGVC